LRRDAASSAAETETAHGIEICGLGGGRERVVFSAPQPRARRGPHGGRGGGAGVMHLVGERDAL